MNRVRKYFIGEAKEGRIKSFSALKAYAKKNKIDISTAELQSIKSGWAPTAVRRNYSRPQEFQTIQYENLADIEIDFAFFYPNYKKQNDGYIGFLMCVCPATNYMNCIPFSNRTMESFEQAVTILCQGASFPALGNKGTAD